MRTVNIKYLVISAILILALLLGANSSLSCSFIQTYTAPPSSSPTTPTVNPIDPNWTPPPIETNAPALPSIADVVAKVWPSVVAINTEVITYDIFNRPFTQQGAGSGWIIDEEGLIVTNNHVIEGAESITVTLADGRAFPAEMVHTDPITDLAVIEINATNLASASIGDSSKLRVGEWVTAIGNPLGQGLRQKEGTISGLELSIMLPSGQTLYDLIETSAAINPGNSGGPLVNMAGEVIGITSAKIAAVGVEGMGYVISIHTAIPIINQLILSGFVIRPYLGVTLQNVNPTLVMWYDLAVSQGAFVTFVSSGSPADIEAGLKEGDVIVSLEGKETSSAQELIQAIHSSQIGQRVKIIFWRGETKNTTYVTLIERPAP